MIHNGLFLIPSWLGSVWLVSLSIQNKLWACSKFISIRNDPPLFQFEVDRPPSRPSHQKMNPKPQGSPLIWGTNVFKSMVEERERQRQRIQTRRRAEQARRVREQHAAIERRRRQRLAEEQRQRQRAAAAARRTRRREEFIQGQQWLQQQRQQIRDSFVSSPPERGRSTG